MKRVLALVGLVVMALLVGCASKEPSLSEEIQNDSQFGRLETSTAAPRTDAVYSEPAGPAYASSYAPDKGGVKKIAANRKLRLKKARLKKKAKRRVRAASSVAE